MNDGKGMDRKMRKTKAIATILLAATTLATTASPYFAKTDVAITAAPVGCKEYKVKMKKLGTVTVYGPWYEKTVENLSRNAKGRASDVIAVAKTQVGYVGPIIKNIRVSYFGNAWRPEISAYNYVADGNKEKSSWCSEFAFWCLSKAKVIPETAKLTNVETFRNYFRNSAYKFHASANNSTKTRATISKNWFKNVPSKGTLKLKDLKSGDILQICTDTSQGQPHHTAIFVSRSGDNNVKVLEGNKKVSGLSQSQVQYGTYAAHDVIAVLRPNYK